MTTLKSLTDSQIRTLRTEAAQHGDDKMVVICDIALDAELALGAEDDGVDRGNTVAISDFGGNLSTCYTGMRLSRDEWRSLSEMSQDEAREAVVESINDAEAA